MSIRVKKGAPKYFFFKPQRRPPEKTLRCKNHDNPIDRKSPTWAPLSKGISRFRLPVFHNEGEEVGHGGGPQLPQRIIVEAGVQGDHLQP